jgi:hypothetical protein
MRENSFGLAPKRGKLALELADANPGLPSQFRAGQLSTRGQNLIGGESHAINSLRVLQTFREEVIRN